MQVQISDLFELPAKAALGACIFGKLCAGQTFYSVVWIPVGITYKASAAAGAIPMALAIVAILIVDNIVKNKKNENWNGLLVPLVPAALYFGLKTVVWLTGLSGQTATALFAIATIGPFAAILLGGLIMCFTAPIPFRNFPN